MPRASHQQTIARQWLILRKLGSRRPGITAREMRDYLEGEGHPVSKRTVERDLNDLSCLFPLETSPGSPPIGWRWREKTAVEFPSLDLLESLSLSLVGDLLTQTLPPSLNQSLNGRIEEAHKKLSALPNQSVAGWAQLARYIPSGPPLLAPEIQPEILDCIEQALVHQKQLRALYQSAVTRTTQEFVMHPVALLSHGSTPYLLANLGPDTELWQYPLHRFQSAEVTHSPSSRPANFDLDHYIASGQAALGKEKTIRLQARVHFDLALILKETPLSEDQSLTEKEDHVLLKASVQQSWQLVFYILSQGSRITVTKPKALRQNIIASLQASLANYQAD